MRAAILQDVEAGKRQLSFEYDGARKRGKVQGRQGSELVVEIDKRQMRVPLTVIEAGHVLKVEGRATRPPQGTDKWFSVDALARRGEQAPYLAGLLKLE
ncbi:MAG: hypothetical protein U5M23_09225 [Marinagarivorans sp.]|nr:hypothetical protein [Marinagarivorans sp.]